MIYYYILKKEYIRDTKLSSNVSIKVGIQYSSNWHPPPFFLIHIIPFTFFISLNISAFILDSIHVKYLFFLTQLHIFSLIFLLHS